MFAKKDLKQKKTLDTLVQEYNLDVEEIERLAERLKLQKQVKAIKEMRDFFAMGCKEKLEEMKKKVKEVFRETYIFSEEERKFIDDNVNEAKELQNVHGKPFDEKQIREEYQELIIYRKVEKLTETFINDRKENLRKIYEVLLKNSGNFQELEAFIVKYKCNEKEMGEVYKQMKDNYPVPDTSSLIIVILSHGDTGVVLGWLFHCLFLNSKFRLLPSLLFYSSGNQASFSSWERSG